MRPNQSLTRLPSVAASGPVGPYQNLYDAGRPRPRLRRLNSLWCVINRWVGPPSGRTGTWKSRRVMLEDKLNTSAQCSLANVELMRTSCESYRVPKLAEPQVSPL